MSRINFSPDDLLSTTRSVRKRLDLTRSVPMETIEECLHLALQAPTSTYGENWRFVVVRDSETKQGIAKWYRQGHAMFKKRQSGSADNKKSSTVARKRLLRSIDHLAQNLHNVSTLVIPCLMGRLDTKENAGDLTYQSTMYASIIPAVWNFMLAARSRSLGTCWTTLHLPYEREVAKILDIPYREIMQVAMIPVAYTLGTEFKAAPRRPLDQVMCIDRWK